MGKLLIENERVIIIEGVHCSFDRSVSLSFHVNLDLREKLIGVVEIASARIDFLHNSMVDTAREPRSDLDRVCIPFLAVWVSDSWPRYVFVDQVMKIITPKNLFNLIYPVVKICSLFERGSELVKVEASWLR
jgi:hypothetical protein